MKTNILPKIEIGNWFVLEPYVMVFKNGKHYLFYNTLNGDYLESFESDLIKCFSQILLEDTNRYVAPISDELASNTEFIQFIAKIRQKFMGDLLPNIPPNSKPFQFAPILNFQKDPNRFKEGLYNSHGNNVLSNLIELNLYVNSSSFGGKDCVYKSSYKQFLSPIQNLENEEISIDAIQTILSQIAYGNVANVNILGGDIFQHSSFSEIMQILSDSPFRKTFHIHYKQISKIHKFSSCTNYSTVVHLEYPYPENIFKIKNSQLNNSHISYSFIVQSINEFESIEKIVKDYKLLNYTVHPFFNGNNLDFFKENTFMTKDDLFDAPISQKELFTRMKINKNDFGKLNILPKGDIYSNFNLNCLGNIFRHTLKDIIYNEIKEQNSWRRVRPNVFPCNNCVYNLLCPPLSNYEIALKQNNLCSLLHV